MRSAIIESSLSGLLYLKVENQMRERTCLKNKDARDAVLNKQSDISHEVVPGGIHAARVRKAAATRNRTTRAYRRAVILSLMVPRSILCLMISL